MSTTEFAPGAEVCTAVIHLEIAPGAEAYVGPLSIGFYPGADALWLECEAARIELPLQHLKDIMKQIKRAERISNESKE